MNFQINFFFAYSVNFSTVLVKKHLNYCSAERSSLKFKTRDVLRPHFFLTNSVGHAHEYFLFLSQVLNVKD